MEAPPSLLDYARVVGRRRLGILALVIVAAAGAFIWGMLQPKMYVARATILPPKDTAPRGAGAALGDMLGGQGGAVNVSGVSVQLPSTATNQDLFAALLASRTMREEVIAHFAKTWGPGVGSMVGSIDHDMKTKGVIALTAEARDPQLAADLANYYFRQLDAMLARYAEQAVKRQEQFYRAQLDRASGEVERAEKEVMAFQAKHRVLAMTDPTKSADGAASLRGGIQALELQREILKMRYTDQHPDVRELDKRIAETKRQYSKNLFGEAMDLPPESSQAKGARREFFVASASMTPVQFAFMKVYRDLKIQESFYVAAVQGLQQIRYGELLTMPRVEFLDEARRPGAPSKPNVLFIVLAAAIAALVAGVLGSFVVEYVARLRGAERARRRSATPVRHRTDAVGETSGTTEHTAHAPGTYPGTSVPVPSLRAD